jgi:hypothetical protein
MKKVRYMAGLAGLAPAAVLGPAGIAAAATTSAGHDTAATTAATKTVSLHHLRAQRPAVDFSNFGNCNAPLSAPEKLTSRNGGVRSLPAGTRVKVTCWYHDSKSVIQDHVVRENINGTEHSWVGHLPDAHVDFGGHSPSVVSGYGLQVC